MVPLTSRLSPPWRMKGNHASKNECVTEQMKTENISLMAEMAESLSQLAIHPQNVISVCVGLCACVCTMCMDGFLSLPLSPLVCKSTRSEVDKWNQLLVLPHFFWLMLGQHGLWQPFAHWCVCGISSPTAFLISWGSFSSFPELICYRVEMMLPSSFGVEWCYQTRCWTLAQAGALRLCDPGRSYVKECESCSPSLCVSWWFEASIKKTDLWLDFMSREDVWERNDRCSHLQPLLAWEPDYQLPITVLIQMIPQDE